MRKMNKIKKYIFKKNQICFVGIRDSDIYYSKNFFYNNISFFSINPKEEPFELRINQNFYNKELFPYLNKKINNIKNRNPKIQFYYYNQLSAYKYSSNIVQNSMCVNSKELLEFLNNKLQLKKWFVESKVPIIPYETFLGRDISIHTVLSRFPNYQTFVVQSCEGGGGVGTFIVNEKCFNIVKEKIHDYQQYIVSPYIPNVSVNTHVFINEKQVVVSPGSVQIIETHDYQLSYRGCDFIAFQNFSKEVKNKILDLSLQISNILRKKGYTGIAGIDFIINDSGKIFCSEINPRFQASTFIIDKFMQENMKNKNEAKSCFELNKMAFDGSMITTLCFSNEINYSSYYYYSDGLPIHYIKEKYELLKYLNIEVFTDGMEYYLDNKIIDYNSYLFRAVFPHHISKISPDTKLWINDNICIKPKPENGLLLKIALLNQGIRQVDSITNIKQGVYESIDITIKNNNFFDEETSINCAYNIHLSKYSPFNIKYENSNEKLYYYNDLISEIHVEKDQLLHLDGDDKKILFLATDRLRIKVVMGCENKNSGKGCKFCNLSISEKSFTVDQIVQSLENFAKLNINFRHILIGGGSSLEDNSWNKIISVCDYLKKHSYFKNKPISIMTMLPPKEILLKLKKAGVEEVAFNLEVANSELAKRLMPGKHNQGKEAYYSTFTEAINIFGIGNVRSALLVGLDKKQDLLDEVLKLANMGVIPCLSSFRALPDTEFSNNLGPDNQYLIEIYEAALELLQTHSKNIKYLGPKCSKCKNNMLIL